ncbi:hypothetical protein VITU102760_06425 [Vibrio tubiashii]|uniref:TetR family transcriptional regulator n=1 Tax=Vibrio tubiashii ATCC 19109 TaxID=1051646 RepID=A0ABN0DDF5_9VIBR|nr:hypothetical protein VITU9109_15713 [Vibrio tubiashii ATCC 19109]
MIRFPFLNALALSIYWRSICADNSDDILMCAFEKVMEDIFINAKK